MTALTQGKPRGEPPVIRPIEDRTAARDALIALLSCRPGPVPPLSQPQWEAFVEEATHRRVGPLAWRRLADHPHADPSPGVLERLRRPYLANAFRNAVLFRETAQVTRALAAESIPVMPLKGLHLARFVYDEPALRSMADLDIMVPREQIRVAERIIVGMGYGPLPRPDLEAHCEWSNHLPAFEKEGAEVLEVHYDIERPTSPFAIDVAGIWSDAVEAEIDGAAVRLMRDEHLLLHLCVHLAYHHRFERASLKGLLDVTAVVTACSLDWDRVARTASRWRVGGFVHTTLRLAREILQAPVPDVALDAIEHSSDDEAVVDIAARFILSPAIAVSESLTEIQRAPGWRRRLAMFLRGVFLSPARLRQLYGLDEGSHRVWALYPIRIADLLRRQGGLLARIAIRTPAVSPIIDRERDRRRIERWAGYSDARAIRPPAG